MRKILFILTVLFQISAIAGLPEDQPFDGLTSLRINQLMAIVCSANASKQTTLQFNGEFLLHNWNLGPLDPKTQQIDVTGACSRSIRPDMSLTDGEIIQLKIDTLVFRTQDNPVLSGSVGAWGFKFYFRSRSKMQDGSLNFAKYLESFVLYHLGPVAFEPKLRKLPFVEMAIDASEKISPAKLSWKSNWLNQEGQAILNLEGLGEQWLIAMNVWSQKNAAGDFVYVNAPTLLELWSNGLGHAGGEKAQGVYWIPAQSYGKGCSNFQELFKERDLLSMKACLDIWARAKP